MNRTLIRNAIALAVAAMGVVDLESALLSRPPERLVALRHLLPTDVLDTSRTFTLLAGALLLVTASGLRRGKHRAFVAALFLSALSVPFNLLKALDFEEATVAAALMFVLGVSGDAFRVKSREVTLGALRSPALIALVGLVGYAIIGCALLGSRYGVNPSFGGALREAGHQLFGIGGSTLALRPGLTHMEHRIVAWYLDSVSVVGFTLLIGLALASLRPVSHRGRHRAERDRVAALVARHGDSSVCAFTLASDSDYFFSSNERAVIAYRFESDTLLVIGDPIGPPEEIPPLLEAFAEHCRERDWQFAFFQARPEYLSYYRRLGWRALHIGEDPLLFTDRFTLEGSAVGDVRRSVRKLEHQGLEARLFVPGENPFDPGRDPDRLLEQLSALSAEWMRGRSGGEKGFCMGRFEPARLSDVWLAVAWNPAVRRVEAFSTWVPIPARRGWALDLMRRRPDSLPGAGEFLVVRSVERARDRGDLLMSLSLSALAKVGGAGAGEGAATAAAGTAAAAAGPEGPAGDDRAREFVMDALARYYDFKGLFHWKKKFNPVFEDRYLVFSDPLSLPRVARALLRVQSPGGLRSYFRRTAQAPAGRAIRGARSLSTPA
jgi:phosphatidylglycerol lysyltransferase